MRMSAATLAGWQTLGSNGAKTRDMPGSWTQGEFPYLSSATCTVTSAATRRYNCLAWAAKESHRRWEPDPNEDYYWPPEAPRALTLEAFTIAYGTLGFKICFSNALEPGVEKIAIFAIERNGVLRPTHAALQLETGAWTSKLGDLEDIEHAPVEAVNGPIYGEPAIYMQRPRSSTNI